MANYSSSNIVRNDAGKIVGFGNPIKSSTGQGYVGGSAGSVSGGSSSSGSKIVSDESLQRILKEMGITKNISVERGTLSGGQRTITGLGTISASTPYRSYGSQAIVGAQQKINQSGYGISNQVTSTPTQQKSTLTPTSYATIRAQGGVRIGGNLYAGNTYIPAVGMTANEYSKKVRAEAVEKGLVKKGEQQQYNYILLLFHL